ncbi:MAG: hypothetical protein JWO82_860 [Akkermansiaceae bacterium]|nr:hypothetical protein [Akkermansiaceae bacterium]
MSEQPARHSKTKTLILGSLALAFPLAGLAIQLTTRHLRKSWKEEDTRLADALYVRRIEVRPAAGSTSILLKLNNASAKNCTGFSVELSWSGGNSVGGRETRDFKLPVPMGQDLALPPWLCPVADQKDLVWTARVTGVNGS